MSALLVPGFPSCDPGDLDVLTLLAATIFLEAEGEPVEGKVAVAWVIRHRVDAGATWHRVILGPEGRGYDDTRAYEPFSCWGDADRARMTARLNAAVTSPILSDCWRAAAGVLWRLLPDPVPAAHFYLNVEVTRRLRKAHDLPAWAADPANAMRLNAAKLVAVIGRHHFLRT